MFTFFVFIYTQWCTTHSEEGSSLIYLLCVCLHIVSGVQHILQKGSSLFYLLCVCLHIVVYNTQCRRAQVLFTFFVFVYTYFRRAQVLFTFFVFVYTQWCTTHIVGLKSCLPSLCLLTHSGVQHILQEGSSLVYLLCVCLHIVEYNTYCRRAQVLFTFFVFVYTQWCTTHIVGGLKSCLPSLCLFTHSGVQHILQDSSLFYLLCVCLHIVVYNTQCSRAQVLFTFFVFAYTQWCTTHIVGGLKSCLPSLCLFTHSKWCTTHSVGGLKSCLPSLCLFTNSGVQHILQEGSSLVYLLCVCLHIVEYNTYCRRAQVLFTFFVFVYTQWCTSHMVGGLKSCLPSLCLFTHSGVQHILQDSSLVYLLCVCLHIVVYNTQCSRAQVLFTFFVFVYTQWCTTHSVGGLKSYLPSLCLFTHSGVQHIVQEGSSLVYLLCVCLPIVVYNTYCRRAQVLFTFFVFVYTQWCTTHIVGGLKSC